LGLRSREGRKEGWERARRTDSRKGDEGEEEDDVPDWALT